MVQSNHALVFGASGLVGWAVVETLLNGYPNEGTFDRVTALVNRPLTEEESHWPISSSKSKFTLASGMNLVRGTSDSVLEQLQAKVPDLETVTHVFYFVFKQHDDLVTEAQLNTNMMQPVVLALNIGCPNLKFFVFPSGTRGYGVYFPERPLEPPFKESQLPLPSHLEPLIHYNSFRKVLAQESAGKQWKYADVCPDMIVGFAPNGSMYNLPAHWATYLSLYALVEGKGSKVPFPGTEDGYTAVFNEVSSTMVAKMSIWASLNPETSAGQMFNVVDNAEPTKLSDRWAAIARYFGLEGTGPSKDSSRLRPSEYIEKHRGVLEKHTKRSNEVFGGPFLDMMGYNIASDRRLDVEKARNAGFTEKADPQTSWIEAFERYRRAGMLPS